MATPKADNKVLLDPKKAQNIAILLRALNVTKEEVCDALCEGEEDHYLKLITPVLQYFQAFLIELHTALCSEFEMFASSSIH